MEIDTIRALDYLQERFTLDGTAANLCTAVFGYWNCFCQDDKIETYLTKLLGPIGFDADDVTRMITDGIITVAD